MSIVSNVIPIGVRKASNVFELNKLLNFTRPARMLESFTAGNDALFGVSNINIIQIGAGGTGGYVAAGILRMLGGLHPVIQDKIHYWLIDGDSFEAKNMGRQLCTEDDLGENKALTIMNNYGAAFDCLENNLHPMATYLTDISQLTDIGALPTPAYKLYSKLEREGYYGVASVCNAAKFRDSTLLQELVNTQKIGSLHGEAYYPITIIIDCVDKNAPRKLIHDYINNTFKYPKIATTDFEKLVYFGDCLTQDTQKNELLTLRKLPFSCFKNDLYVIASGNSQYNGQVYWGRTSGIFNIMEPLTYNNMYVKEPGTTLTRTDTDIATLIWGMYLEHAFPVDKIPEGQKYVAPARAAYHKSLDITEDNIVKACYADIYAKKFSYFKSQYMSVPTPYERFPELTDVSADETEEAMSCAERAAINVQNIATNQTAAQLTLNYVHMLIRNMFPMSEEDYMPLETVGVKFDVSKNIFVPEYSTPETLEIPEHE